MNSSRRIILILSSIFVLTQALLPCTATVVHTGKAIKHKSAGKHKYRYGNYFVPPPPAYMPSILPELSMNYHAPTSQTVESANSKYIYARQGYEDAAPVASRSGVTTWSWRKTSSNL